MIRSLLLIYCVLFPFVISAQERAGLTLGKYNGINALSLNPAFAFKSDNKWDVQLAGAHIFGNTSYAHITNTNLFKYLRNSSDVFILENKSDIAPNSTDMTMTFNDEGKTSFATKGEVMGPGLIIPLGEKRKVGFSTKLRAQASSNKIPSAFNYYNALSLKTDSTYTMNPVSGGGMIWAELNLHYAQELSKNITLGATLKLLRGYTSAYVRNEIDFDFQQFNADDIDILTAGRFRVGYPSDEENISPSGSGIGIDIGITINDVVSSGFQLGISLLDIGHIHYNAYAEVYSFDTTLELDGDTYNNIETLEELRTQLNRDFVTSSDADHNMQLPTAIAVQFSRQIDKQLSIEGYWVQKLAVLPFSTFRPNSISLSAVYERKHLSAYLPVTLYNYTDLRVGAAVRLGPLTLGSDQVMSLFGNRDFSGSDIYANIMVYPFQLWNKNKKNKKGAEVQCYW